jgi:hypothetical protein
VLPCGNQIGHGTDGILDRNSWVDPVLIVEVNHIDAESLERGIAGRRDAFRATVQPHTTLWITGYAEFCCNHYLIPTPSQYFSQQALIGVRTVHVRGIPEIDAQFQGAIQGSEILLFVGGSVEISHTHAAQAQL